MALREATELLREFKQAVQNDSGDYADARSMLARLKMLIAEFPSLPPAMEESPNAEGELLVARDVLETACFLSVRLDDAKGLERHFMQLKPLYQDYSDRIASSDVRPHVVGLVLMHLLVANDMPSFHVELEHLSESELSDRHVAFPVELNEFMIEGSYHKVLAARSRMPSPLYEGFMRDIVHTVRDEIAECSATAYESLPLDAAQHMMLFDSADEMRAYIAEHQPNWTIENGVIHFVSPHKAHGEVASMAVIENTMHYATELERIV